MPDYSLGKVYKIVGNGKVYVGATTRPLLSQRLAKHKNAYSGWLKNGKGYTSSFECIPDPECYIELLEVCNCSSIDELKKCERKWIEQTDCVNILVAGRPIQETRREYYETNKNKLLQQGKEYREAHKEQYVAYKEKYRQKKNPKVADV